MVDEHRQANKLLREEHVKRGWSQKYVADKIHISRDMISRWESGEHETSLQYQRALCELFGLNAIELGFLPKLVLTETSTNTTPVSLLPFPQQDAQNIMVTFSHLKEQMLGIPRRQMLHTLLNTACTSLVLSPYAQLHPDSMERLMSVVSGRFSIDEETLDDLEIITQRFWKLRKNTSLDLFSVVIEHFQMVTQLLKRTYPERISKRLYSLVSQVALMLGTMLSDIQDLPLSWSYYTFALHSAQIAANADLRAVCFGRMGLLSIYNGQPDKTLTLLEGWQNLAIHDMRISAWLLAIKTEAHAHMHEVDATIETLHNSEEYFTKEGQFEKDVYATGFSQSRLLGYKGACFSRVGKGEFALTALQEALTLADVSTIRHRSTLFVDIGCVLAQQGEMTDACNYASQALDITTQTRSLSVLERIYTLRSLLNQWRDTTPVKRLDQQIQGVHQHIAASRPTNIY